MTRALASSSQRRIQQSPGDGQSGVWPNAVILPLGADYLRLHRMYLRMNMGELHPAVITPALSQVRGGRFEALRTARAIYGYGRVCIGMTRI